MAHAIFNVSPVKFLSSIQDHVFTVTPSFKNKLYNNNSNNGNGNSQITLQLTSDENVMTEIAPSPPLPLPVSSTVPIDIPLRSVRDDMTGSYSTQQQHLSCQQDILLNSNPAEELTTWFDGLAVNSPAAASPQQVVLNSPLIGSPAFLGSPQSPSFLNGPLPFLSNSANSPTSHINSTSQFVVGSNNSNYSSYLQSPATSPAFFVGSSPSSNYIQSPTSPSHFLNSPTNGIEQDLTAYLSPSLQPFGTSPSSPYTSNGYLFPPTLSRSCSPVPDDVILTTSEVNDYLSSSPNTNTHHNFTFLAEQFTVIEETTTVSEKEGDHAKESSRPTTITKDTLKTPSNIKKKKSSAVAHKKIHHCPHCAHTSNRANNMREHIQIHNPNRPKPYACKLCNRAFARKHDMNRHYLTCKKYVSKVSMKQHG
ncbi:MAG: hypothetical protein EXX96DRAFT_500203 [Benjaminiella poitrasii]|nr:MAG: hypothetical protein EXX96DRAFT_500203 [Benjaminiella poitrasii]